VVERIEFRAMGSHMMAALDVDGPRARLALAEIPSWFEDWEQHLSRFRPDSELNRLNRRSGNWISVSPVMWELLNVSGTVERMSAGLVTPALQGSLEAFGYDRSFEMVATLDAEFSLQAIQPRQLSRLEIEMDGSQRRVRMPAGTRLDFGGIAKGWAADRAVERLDAVGAGLVDAGGDVATVPPGDPGTAWPVGITDPHDPQELIGLLALQGEAVATSGRDVHHWRQGGKNRHHIIDPRTGEPAENHVLTATAIAPTALEAEVAAKCALILGEAEGLAWLDARPEYAGLMVLDDGSTILSKTMGSYLWSE
jgi:thiamine biosynthesis lipoprotein